MEDNKWKIEIVPSWIVSLIKTNLLIISFCSLIWYCTPNEPNDKASNLTKLPVVATMYEAVPSQTDLTPNITADGTRINTKYAGKYRYLAVSRDLLSLVNYGDYVVIEGINGTYDGVWQVKDTMHPRWTNRVDLLCNPGTSPFRKDSATMTIYN